MNPKTTISSDIFLQDAFTNPLTRLYKRLFPLGHKELLAPGHDCLIRALKDEIYVLGESALLP